jgi:hypothetical protein
MSSEHQEPNEVIIYTGSDGQTRVQMRFTGRDVWMTQQQMGELYGIAEHTVTYHLKSIYADDELEQGATARKIRVVRIEGERTVARELDHYNLDAIISVGYRVSSKRATKFRQWATRILTEYTVKGHVVDVERLKDPAASDYFQELLEKIRDIRSSERHVWKRVLELASLCNDHETAPREQLEQFYATIQNTVHWGVTQHTAAEIIHARVDAKRSYCGLTNFKGNVPTVEEAHIAKNYYGAARAEPAHHPLARLLRGPDQSTPCREAGAVPFQAARVHEVRSASDAAGQGIGQHGRSQAEGEQGDEGVQGQNEGREGSRG